MYYECYNISFQSTAFTFSALTSLTERGDNMCSTSQVTIFIFMSLLLQQKDQKTSYLIFKIYQSARQSPSLWNIRKTTQYFIIFLLLIVIKIYIMKSYKILKSVCGWRHFHNHTYTHVHKHIKYMLVMLLTVTLALYWVTNGHYW